MAGAGVHSIEGLIDFVARLAEFGQDAREALTANDMEIQRAVAWLDEQVTNWKREIRVRREALHVAKTNLNRRKMMKTLGREPDCTEQEAELKRAQKRLQVAETRLANSQKYGPVIRRAVDEYHGQARHLANLLEADLPQVRAKLTQRIGSLETYVAMEAPDTVALTALAGASSDQPLTPSEPPPVETAKQQAEQEEV